MKKVSMFLIYLLSFIYLEFLYRILLYDNVFRLSNVNMLLFLVFFALFIYLISKLFKEKANKVIFYIILGLICLWFSAQYVVKGFLDFYISFSILQIADQVGSFLGKAVIEILRRIFGIILLFMPLIVSIILRKKINFKKNSFAKDILLIIFCFLAYGIYYVSLNIRKDEDYSVYMLYHDVNNPALNIEKVGILNTFCLDTYRVAFGFNEKIIIKNKKTNKKVEPTEIVYDYNNLNIDFDSLIANTNDATVKDMSTYFQNESGTLQNEYTGLFKGKNLILFMAESFNEVAVREDTTPTLYKLANSSFVFNNYYTPTIYSTIGGEFQELSGLYAVFSNLSKWRSGTNSYPMGLATMFKNAGYNTYAYHNHSYTFQDRNVYLKSIGFDNFKGCWNGMEKLITCQGIWPESDVDMIEATNVDFVNDDKPFMVFYASVSGHAGYSWSNAMAKKHKDEILELNLGYSEPVTAYLATQMEFDQSIKLLLEKLEEAGKLDDTVIVIAGDHYPYELTTEQMNEAATYKKDGTIEINHSKLIIWNNKMETVKVEKVGSSIDILPTVYNLFNLPYDSRLIIGNDILSTEDGLAMFGDNSWVTNKGKYFASKGVFEPANEGIVDDEYAKNMNQDVRNRITMSKYIMDKNYYKLIWDYVK